MPTYLGVLTGLHGALAAGVGALHVEGALLECLLHLVPWVSGLQVGGELVKV